MPLGVYTPQGHQRDKETQEVLKHETLAIVPQPTFRGTHHRRFHGTRKIVFQQRERRRPINSFTPPGVSR
jgi:hypothetical protein